MGNINSDGVKRNRQRGGALILVLIALSVGSLIIVPTLDYVYTGLKRVPISERLLMEQYSADAAIEYGLWQLAYDADNITDDLNPDNPSSNSTITINDIDVPIITEITQSPLGEDWPFPVPESQSGIHLSSVLDIQSPYWSDDGQIVYFPHVVYMYNDGDSSLHPNSLIQHLDPRFEYVEGSYDGFPADLTETYVDDHWELYFDLQPPLPKLEAGEATFVSFLTSTDYEISDNETFISSGQVGYAAFEAEEGEIFYGEYSFSTVGYYYDLTVDAGSCTMLVSVGITETGEVVILSWQVE